MDLPHTKTIFTKVEGVAKFILQNIAKRTVVSEQGDVAGVNSRC
jgi:hypothetical protein